MPITDYIYSNYAFQIRKITTRQIWGPTVFTVRWAWAIHYHLTCMSLTLTSGVYCSFGSPRINVISELMNNNSWRSDYLFFPSALFTTVNRVIHVFKPNRLEKQFQKLQNQFIKLILGTSLVIQWLRLYASTSGGTGSIPGQGTEIPCAVWHGQNNNSNKKNENLSLRFCPLKPNCTFVMVLQINRTHRT